jgi:hypothetical protein
MDRAGVPAGSPAPTHVQDRVEHRYDEDEVRNQYAALGEGPLTRMLHSFPDY